MTTTSTAKPSIQSASQAGTSWMQDVDNACQKLLNTDFQDIKASNSRAKYLVLGMWYTESRFGTTRANGSLGVDVVYDSTGNKLPVAPVASLRAKGAHYRSSTFDKYYTYTPVLAVGAAVARQAGISRAHGMGQVMGAYHVRGIERIIIDPNDAEKMRIVAKYGLEYNLGSGSDIFDTIYNSSFGGFTGVERGMAASLCVLRDKLKRTGTLESALAAYLGVGVDVITGLSTDKYVANITAYANKYESGGTIGSMPSGSSAQVASATASAPTCA